VQEGKLSLESMNIAAEKRQELVRLFPEAQTESGKIDFDQLKRALGESVDAGRERYGMNWPGKADCFRLIQAPSTATLLPVRDESIRFDKADNVVIEGDNLEVLKLLQKGYQNKVKMIYIDPPYNTGSDFIYPDDYVDNLKNYLQYTGQIDSDNKKFSNNLETDGRYHSNWLNMMYPRLYLARNLLRDDGILFLSIDEKEASNAALLLDSIFGSGGHLATIAVVSNLKGRSDDKYYATAHNSLLAYGKAEYVSRGVILPDDYFDDYPEIADDGRRYRLQGLRKRGAGARRIDRPNMFYTLYVDPNTKKVSTKKDSVFNQEVVPKLSDGEDGRWRWGKSTADLRSEELLGGRVGPEQRWDVFQVDFAENEAGVKRVKPKTVWSGSEFANETGTLELKRLLGKSLFDTVKPLGLLAYCIDQATVPGDLILDFFAGSGTTGHAVLDINEEEGVSRNFILVQLPEPTRKEQDGQYKESAAWKAGYKTIADITKGRVRKVIQQRDSESEGQLDLQQQGELRRKEGFRVFRLAPSNFKIWDAHTDEGVQGLERQMELAVNHIMPDRTAEDLFYEILMKSEYPLTAKVEIFDAAGIAAFSVEDDALIVCVERKVTAEAVTAIAKRSPSKVIFLDEAFSGNDQLKANAKMNFESAGVKRFETV